MSRSPHGNSSSSGGNTSNDERGSDHSHGSRQSSNIPHDQSPILERDDKLLHSELPAYTVDHTYLRSIEGILRLATIPVAVIFLALDLAGYKGPGEWFNLFVAVGWLIYAIITITVEVFLPGVYVHRLIDGIICIVWTGVWGVACIIAISNAAVHKSSILGGASFFSVVLLALVAANAFFAMRTWRTYEGGTKGSEPIFNVVTTQ